MDATNLMEYITTILENAKIAILLTVLAIIIIGLTIFMIVYTIQYIIRAIQEIRAPKHLEQWVVVKLDVDYIDEGGKAYIVYIQNPNGKEQFKRCVSYFKYKRMYIGKYIGVRVGTTPDGNLFDASETTWKVVGLIAIVGFLLIGLPLFLMEIISTL
jgi:hypothetical protein